MTKYNGINVRRGLVLACMAVLINSPATALAVDVSVVWKTKMRFGRTASDVDTAGTVTIDANANTKTITGGLVDFGGTWKRGKFQILGDPKAYVIVTLPSSFIMQNNAGTFDILVDNIHMNLTNPVRLNNRGKKNVFIGGTLHIDVNQKNRTYKNETFIIDVEYQ